MRISFNEVRRNKINSFILISLFIILIGFIGGAIGLYFDNIYIGLIIAMVFSIIYSLIAYKQGGNMVLKLTGAKPVTKRQYPHLYHTIEGLALAAGIKAPKAYIIEDDAMNAFATGTNPDNAAITVTTGLLKKLNRQELEGVVAHEMAHIKNYDIRFMILATVLIGIVSLLSHFMLRMFLYGGSRRLPKDGRVAIILIAATIILAVLAPIFSQMIKLAISRKREYMADATGAILTRYPPGLASALRKIGKDTKQLKAANSSNAHLFIYSPFKKKKNKRTFKGLFSTHPPIEEGVSRLEQM